MSTERLDFRGRERCKRETDREGGGGGGGSPPDLSCRGAATRTVSEWFLYMEQCSWRQRFRKWGTSGGGR